MNVINLEGVKWFVEDYVKNKMFDCYRDPKKCSELEKTVKDLKELKTIISKLISEAEHIIKIAKGKKELTYSEIMTIAISKRPFAPEYIKRRAKEIIQMYRLTPEEVNRIYESVFGKSVQL